MKCNGAHYQAISPFICYITGYNDMPRVLVEILWNRSIYCNLLLCTAHQTHTFSRDTRTSSLNTDIRQRGKQRRTAKRKLQQICFSFQLLLGFVIMPHKNLWNEAYILVTQTWVRGDISSRGQMCK